jgi:hypothetical protein
MGFIKKAIDFFSLPTHSRTMGILIMLVLVSAISLTVIVAQQQQTIKQHADSSSVILPGCGSGRDNCVATQMGRDCATDFGDTNNVKNTPMPNLCLSTTGFSSADKINNKSLVCCDGPSLGSSTIMPIIPDCSDSLTCVATQMGRDCATDFGDTNNVKNTPMPNLCLSTTSFDSADKINNKSLVCCSGPQDLTAPTVGTIAPITATVGIPTIFMVTVSDQGGIASCSLLLDGLSIPMNVSGNLASASYTFPAGSKDRYFLSTKCQDLAGNIGMGESVWLTVSTSITTTCTVATQGTDCVDGNPCTNDICSNGTCDHTKASSGTVCNHQTSPPYAAIGWCNDSGECGSVPPTTTTPCNSTNSTVQCDDATCSSSSTNECLNNGTKQCWYRAAGCTQTATSSQTCSIDKCVSPKTCTNGTCTTSAPPPAGTCTVTASPSSLSLAPGGTGVITANVNGSGTYHVSFTSNNPSIATVSPGYAPTAPFSTTVTIPANTTTGTTTIRISVDFVDASCETNANITVTSGAAAGDTIIQLPAGAFATLFTNSKGELIAHADQNLTMYLYNLADDTKTASAVKSNTPLTTISSSGNSFSFSLGSVTAGQYKALLKSPKYLRVIEGNVTIPANGGTISLSLAKRLADGAGDVNNDNALNILDYNAILGCVGDKKNTSTCTTGNAADLNDDGAIDGVDLNIFLVSLTFAHREGD